MSSRNVFLAIIAVVIAVSIISSAFYFVSSNNSQEVTSITWHRTGGFIGLSEQLSIQPDGLASYTSNHFGDGVLLLGEDEIESFLALMINANFYTLESTYPAKTNVADYFNYMLTMQTGSDSKTVEWVDDWASEKVIPAELGEIQLYIETVIERIHQNIDLSEDADKRAIRIAQDFIIQAPTFKYDGVPDTLAVTDTMILESFPVQYVVTITFECLHAGYGDRAGETLAQVITPHIATVKVVNDNVISVILDGQWDELNQQPKVS